MQKKHQEELNALHEKSRNSALCVEAAHLSLYKQLDEELASRKAKIAELQAIVAETRRSGAASAKADASAASIQLEDAGAAAPVEEADENGFIPVGGVGDRSKSRRRAKREGI